MTLDKVIFDKHNRHKHQPVSVGSRSSDTEL